MSVQRIERTTGVIIIILLLLLLLLLLLQDPTDITNRNNYEVGACQGLLVYQKREFAVGSSSVKFNDPKFKNEMIMRIDMKNLYFSNYLFAINFFCC